MSAPALDPMVLMARWNWPLVAERWASDCRGPVTAGHWSGVPAHTSAACRLDPVPLPSDRQLAVSAGRALALGVGVDPSAETDSIAGLALSHAPVVAGYLEERWRSSVRRHRPSTAGEILDEHRADEPQVVLRAVNTHATHLLSDHGP